MKSLVSQVPGEGRLPGLLLACNGALRSLTGTSVGLGALSVDRKAATVANSLVASDLDLAADVGGDLTTEVTFYLEVALDVIAKGNELVVGQILDADLAADLGVRKRLECSRTTDAVNVSQCDLNALIARNVYAG